MNQIKNYIFRFLGKLLKRTTPGVFVSCCKCKFSFKQEQELINFSYQTVTERHSLILACCPIDRS